MKPRYRWIVAVRINPDNPDTEMFGFLNETEAREFMKDVIAAGAAAIITDTQEKENACT